ncbi:MAG TPA: hypothetical protein VGB53_13990 [Rubricoccaceae bacterium]|jgi:protocatechuate 3,4-dioxygenase beta subunit
MNPTPIHDDEDNDDEPVGTVLTRRRAIALLGMAPFAAWLAACSASDPVDSGTGTTAGSCVAQPELTEGPYYVDENLNRSDIRINTPTGAVSAGVPLVLTFNVSRLTAGACTTLPDAIVDVWHADALGNYSDVGSFRGQDFLRGLQVTDASGQARFTTVYPGWYQGRAVHIHFKIRSAASASQTYEFTSQLFFDDNVSRALFTSTAPYSQKGAQTTLNSGDGIYRQGGTGLLLAPTRTADGYAATFDIALTL